MASVFTLAGKLVDKSLRFMKPLAVLAFTGLLVVPSYAQLSNAAAKQIAEVIAFKKTFSPAEQKMSSSLVLASRKAHHMPQGNLARFADNGRISDSRGMLLVEVGADLSPSLMSSNVMSGVVKDNGQVPQQAYAEGHIRARVNASQLLELAAHPDVKSLREADLGTTNVGSVTSQGYVTHTANKVIANGITGAGVTVGVLSDSASPARIAALIASGDLPSNVQVVPGQAGSVRRSRAEHRRKASCNA